MNNRFTGEAAGSIYYGPTVEEIEVDLLIGVEFLREQKELTRETLYAISNLSICSASRSALCCMVLNYLSGESRRYPWEILELGSPVGIKSSYTIGIDEPQKMIAAISESEYPIIKIKMGGPNDDEIMEVIKSEINKEIRVDANGGWDPERAEEMIFKLAKSGVKIIEQPTSAEHVSEWPRLKGDDTNVELIMDEGLNSLDDFEKYREYIDGINIKMDKCGGIIEGTRIARRAREDKKKVMLGCMVESSVGIAQSVYMSAQADYFDLDGPLLLKDDIAIGIRYDRESIEVDREIIGGPKIKRDVIEKYIRK